MKANRKQLAKIHIAKKDLNLSEENYRATLSGFADKEGNAITSAADLSYDQAEILINTFKAIGWKPKASRKAAEKKPITILVPKNRPEEYASEKQLKMLAGIWVDKANEKTESAFDHFIRRIAGIDHYQWLLKSEVQKVKKGIESL